MKNAIKILWVLLGGVAVYFVYKKFSGGGSYNPSGSLSTATTGTAGSGFANFYPGWRQVPTPSAPQRPSSLPGTITAATNGIAGIVTGLRGLFTPAPKPVILTSADMATVSRSDFNGGFDALDQATMDYYGFDY